MYEALYEIWKTFSRALSGNSFFDVLYDRVNTDLRYLALNNLVGASSCEVIKCLERYTRKWSSKTYD